MKTLVLELVTGLGEEREQHRYDLEYRLVRADGIGSWVEVLDEVLTGPASQHLVAAARTSRTALSQAFGPVEVAWQRTAFDELAEVCRCLDNSFDTMPKSKTSLRHWAQSIAWLRNRTRGHGAPQGATLSGIAPHLQASLKAVTDNAPAFSRDWAHLRRSLSGKYRVTTFGGNRDPFAHLTTDDQHTLLDGTYVDLDGLKRTTLLLSDPELDDFFFPNGNFRGNNYEVISYASDETKREPGTAYLLLTTAQPASETSAQHSLEVTGNVFTNMPPARSEYVARPLLEAELAAVLTNERHPVVTLQGRGGVGKTSLALAVLHELASREDLGTIIWFSARDIDLLAEGPKVVRADVLTTQEVARDFAVLMGRPELKGAPAETYFADSLACKTSDGPFIFVLDNFETIREQHELYAFLDNAVRLPNKILITTRTRDFKADYPIEVKGMTKAEFTVLVTETAQRLAIEGLIDSSYREELFQESDGHPYITKVLLGEIARAGRQLSLKRVVATKEAMLDALFDRSYAALTASAQRVFLTLCAWRSQVPRLGLEAVLLRPDNDLIDVERALEELFQASLVEELAATEGSLFLSVPLAAAVFGKRKLVTSPLKLAIDADLELMHEFGPASAGEANKGLMPRVERLTRAAAQRAEKEGDLRGLEVLEYIATGFSPAWLNLSQLKHELGDAAGAVDSLKRYLEASPGDADGWRRLVGLYRGGGDALGEMHARLQLVELARPSFQDLSDAAKRLNYLTASGELKQDADEKRLVVQRLRNLMEDRYREGDATDLSRLAWLCLHDKDTVAAGKWAAIGLELDATNPHCQSLVERACLMEWSQVS